MSMDNNNCRRKRYERNGTSITPAENDILAQKKVCVIGCGGLGGYIAEMLLRVGIINLTLVDSDFFDETNLNRQLFSLEANLGKPKVYEGQKRLLAIDPIANIAGIKVHLDDENVVELIKNHDIVVDALDNITTRRIVAKACNELNIPFVHGAISGLYGQVSVLMPGGSGLEMIYGDAKEEEISRSSGNLPYVAGLIASMQCNETIKLLLRKTPNLQEAVAFIDIANYKINIFKK